MNKRPREQKQIPKAQQQVKKARIAPKTQEAPQTYGTDFLTKDKKDVEAYRTENRITVFDEPKGSFYIPCQTFDDAGFSSELNKAVKGFKVPTPIQGQCWPIIMSGRDVIGIAETGSGKTLAFGLPALTHVQNSNYGLSPSVLVLSPTRELADQIGKVLIEAAKTIEAQVCIVYGGVPKYPQEKALQNGVQVVVATPGRLADLMQAESCDVSQVQYLILDEADRMLDQGFEQQIRSIISSVSSERQTLMFSATWSKPVQKIAADFLKNPVKVSIGSEDLNANRRVTQIVEVIEDQARSNRLLELLKKYHVGRKNRILIFALYKWEAAELEGFLRKKGYKVGAIHGNNNQQARTQALESFVNGSIPLLVATDVASRGLDIPQVEYVINYSFPLTIEDYIHRIGRTARAGATGIAHTFFQKANKTLTGRLYKVLKDSNQTIPPELLQFGLETKKEEPKLGKIDLKASQATHITFSDSDEE